MLLVWFGFCLPSSESEMLLVWKELPKREIKITIKRGLIKNGTLLMRMCDVVKVFEICNFATPVSLLYPIGTL